MTVKLVVKKLSVLKYKDINNIKSQIPKMCLPLIHTGHLRKTIFISDYARMADL